MKGPRYLHYSIGFRVQELGVRVYNFQGSVIGSSGWGSIRLGPQARAPER